jgi:hypothetical protein
MRIKTPITRLSPVSFRENTMVMEIDPKDLGRYNAGGLVQDCFPYLTPAEREFIISGCTQEDWFSLFGPDNFGEEIADEG